jgi:hypothetical protein
VRVGVRHFVDQIRHHGAQRRPHQGHAHEVGGNHQPGADEAADARGHHLLHCVADAPHGTGGQRAEDEPEQRQDDPEQPVAEEARDDAAEQQDDGGWKLIGRGKHS